MKKIDKNLNFSGVYCILNTINGKMYIGSSKNIKTRLYKHRSLLRNNKHDNQYLQNAYNKYCEDAFIILVLEKCEELTIREQYYINTLNAKYNLTKEVIRNTLSKESRLKQSETRKKLFLSKQLKPNCAKKIIKYDLDGKKVAEYSSIIEAARENNSHRTAISNVVNHKNKQNKGFVYREEGDNYFQSKEEILKSNNTFEAQMQSLTVLNLHTKEKLVFKSIKKCAEYFGVSAQTVSQVLHKSKTKIYKHKYKIKTL